MIRHKGFSKAWWSKKEEELHALVPGQMIIENAAKALLWFVDEFMIDNPHIADPYDLTIAWLEYFPAPLLKILDNAHICELKAICFECIKVKWIPLLPLFVLVDCYFPRALDRSQHSKCAFSPTCQLERKSKHSPCCSSHTCHICYALGDEPDWRNKYRRVDAPNVTHFVTHEPEIATKMRAESKRRCFNPPDEWCNGVRRACSKCNVRVLPTAMFIDDSKMSQEQTLCNSCWTSDLCAYCNGMARSTKDVHRNTARLCDSAVCNIQLKCKRCNDISHARTLLYRPPRTIGEELMCPTCQKEAYACSGCRRTSNSQNDMLWMARLVWKTETPRFCMRCIPPLKKIPDIPNGGSKWIMIRAMTMRLWWDRQSIISSFDSSFANEPTEFFKKLVSSRMCHFASVLCQKDPNNWNVLMADAASWDCTYMLFVRLLKQPRDIFIKIFVLL